MSLEEDFAAVVFLVLVFLFPPTLVIFLALGLGYLGLVWLTRWMK